VSSARRTKEQTVSLGKAIYAERLRAQLEPGHNGEFVAIDVESGDYEVAPALLDAVHRLRARRPGAVPFLHRIGHAAAFKLGGRWLPRPS